MLKIKKYFLIFIFCTPCFVFAEVSYYEPNFSPEHHEISLSFLKVSPFHEDLYLSKGIPNSASYAFYPSFAEIDHKSHKLGKLGLQVSSHYFDLEKFKTKQLCPLSHSNLFIHQIGFVFKTLLLKDINPFIGYGKSFSDCINSLSLSDLEDKSYEKSLLLDNFYASLGVLFSFKLVDRYAIHSLDEGYYLNDIAVHVKCSWIYNKSEIYEKDNRVCEMGMSFAF